MIILTPLIKIAQTVYFPSTTQIIPNKRDKNNIFLLTLYMTFISTYNEAMKILTDIGSGTCNGTCKSTWTRNLKYALKTKKNPLALNKRQRKNMTEKLKSVSGRNPTKQHNKTLKKYKTRNSPPYPANEHCNKQMVGNDNQLYISKPNVNNVCSWKKI